MERFNSETILAYGMNDYAMGRKAALRSLVWFGFGYHLAHQKGDKEAREYLADMKSLLKDGGAVKSETSTKSGIAKRVGAKFGELFASELAAEWKDDADMIQACFMAAQASGATTVKRLDDWATHGNPNYTDDEKDRKAQEKADKQEAERIDRLKATQTAEIAPMSFEAVVEPTAVAEPDATPAPAPVQNLNLADAVASLIEQFGADAVQGEVLAQLTQEVAHAAVA